MIKISTISTRKRQSSGLYIIYTYIVFLRFFEKFDHGGMITGGLIRKAVLLMKSPRGTACEKLKYTDRFGHAN